MSSRKVMVMILLMLACFAGIVAKEIWNENSKFANGTTINGVECGRLTVEQAKQRLENSKVSIRFSEEDIQLVEGIELGRTISDVGKEEIRNFLSMQKEDDGKLLRTFNLGDTAYEVDEITLEKCLLEFHELDEDLMEESRDAYIEQTQSGRLQIVAEVVGNKIDVEVATQKAYMVLQKGKDFIDFEEITQKPKLTSTSPELVSKVQKVNNALSASVTYKLSDGSSYVLNSDTIASWIQEYQTEDFDIDLTQAVTNFVKELNQTVRRIGTNVTVTIKSGTYTLPVAYGYRDEVNVQLEVEQLLKDIQSGVAVQRTPYYARFNDFSNLNTYIEVDIPNQWVKLYIDGELKVSVPCITGMKGRYDTPTGIFFASMKASPYTMYKYGTSKVDTWVTVNGNVGFHDASGWRSDSEYTPDRYTYDGSHGCINMKKADARAIYDNILLDVTCEQSQQPVGFMPIIIHN